MKQITQNIFILETPQRVSSPILHFSLLILHCATAPCYYKWEDRIVFSKLDYKYQRRIIIVLFLIVPLTFLLLFTYLPAINMISYSFTSWKGYGNKTFVGLKNYIDIFSNPETFAVFKNSIYYFIGGIIQLIVAFYLAVVVNSKLKAKNFFKSIFFFPYL